MVVSFNPDDGFEKRLAALSAQVSETIVVDNTTKPADRARVVAICRRLGCVLHANGENVGVAEALNRGVSAARQRGATAVLTMDHDSSPSSDMVAELLTTLNDARAAGLRVGLVAPGVIDGATGRGGPDRGDVRVWRETTLAITSGSLVPLSVFESVGLFRSDFFIDCVDQEFCLRLREHGYRVVQSHRALLIHHLGSPRLHHVLGRTFIPTNHPPSRRFYMARNLVWTSKLLLLSQPRVVLPMMFKLVKAAVLIAGLEENKLAKLRAIASGVIAGIGTRPGRPPRLA